MVINWDVIKATSQCHYKAWAIASEKLNNDNFTINENIIDIHLQINSISLQDKTATIAWYDSLNEKNVDRIRIHAGSKSEIIKLSKPNAKAKKLLADAKNIIDKNEPPAFYKNPHCNECHLKESCLQKLKQRDCISLLGGMSPHISSTFHKKGIFSILQLSHIFRPRRRNRILQKSGKFPFELKALAIREQKTYVLHKPELKENPISIYLDMEGLPDENFIYLIGGVIRQPTKPEEQFSFWANSGKDEQNIFKKLFDVFDKYPEAAIYHYGSYETKALKYAVKKWSFISPEENNIINLLSFFRTHVFPPTYTNGLKEIANFLKFDWSDVEASGLKSIEWRKNWEQTNEENDKQKLIDYNLDDCRALIKLKDWFVHLANDNAEKVQQVAKMKRHSPYNFTKNDGFGEDFTTINKAAYFDYQHSKIYWRNEKKISVKKNGPKHFGRGQHVWQPKNVNQIIQIPPLKKCPHCGHCKLYHAAKQRTFIQTDIKFTSRGIKQWIVEYHSGKGKCAKCRMKYNDSVLRNLYYGDNLIAWAINMYVNYKISFALISRLVMEQFGIWVNPTYFNDRNYAWWQKFKPEVDYCWKIILNSPVIHIDETTVRLSKGADRGYVWAFATPHTVFYHLTLNREADFLHEWLKDYKGIIITDFYAGYESLPVKRQKCLIHLIRDLNDELYKNPFDEEYKKMVSAFGQLLKKIILTIDKYGLKKLNLKKHIKETNRFYNEYVDIKYKTEFASKAAKRLKRHWDELWTFLQHDGIPWNNNNAEAAVKAFALHRRNVNGQVNENGLKEYLSMLTIAQTCRYRNISFLDYLRRNAGIWQNIPAKLLPGYLPIEQTKVYAAKMKFKTIDEWRKWNESGKRPAFISPDYFFIKNGQ
jgi:transposase IS66 family protein/RNase H-like protein